MTKSWRPKDWIIYQNISRDSRDYTKGGITFTRFLTPNEKIIFEAGADAMLEALRVLKDEQQSAVQRVAELMGNAMARGRLSGEPKGHWLFIPEE